MLWNLLSNSTDSSTNTTGGCGDPKTTVVFLIMIVVIVLFMFWNKQSQKKREQEAQAMLNAIKPGNKVKTIGGVCGIVVEVCPEDNTFVMETGSEASGKSFMKFDMQAIYQTDAVVEKDAPKAEAVAEAVEEAPAEETVAEETAEVQE